MTNKINQGIKTTHPNQTRKVEAGQNQSKPIKQTLTRNHNNIRQSEQQRRLMEAIDLALMKTYR